MEKEKLTVTLSFRVSPEMQRRLEDRARDQDRMPNALIRKYVKEGLERDERIESARKRKVKT